MELRKPRLVARAVFPYTTACSPCKITFPGADTLTVYKLSIPLNIMTYFFNIQLSTNTHTKKQ